MKRKMVTVLLAGLLTAQSVFPAFAEELAVPEMAATNVETEAQTAEEQQPAQTEAEAVTEQQSAQTEAPNANVLDSVGEDEEELIISSENGSGEIVDLDELEAGLMTASVTENGTVTLDDFKDVNFWFFLCDHYDQDGDNELNEKEISSIKELDLSGNDLYHIWTLDGIEHLTSLVKLICGNYVNFDSGSLDISKNTALTYLDCSNKGLFELNLSGNTSLETLICKQNRLYDLDVGTNAALKTLDCSENCLKRLNVSGATTLENLDCSGNDLLELDLSKNNQLKSCIVSTQSRICLAEVVDDVDGKKWRLDLTELFGNDNQPYNFAFSNGSAGGDEGWSWNHYDPVEPENGILKVPYGKTKVTCERRLGNANFVSFEVTLVLQEEDWSEIPLDEKHFPDQNFREALYALQKRKDDFLSEDEIQDWTHLNIPCKGITDLSGIEYLTELIWLDCSENQLTSIDVSKNTALTYLSCDKNQLNSLDVTENGSLTSLYCNSNNLTELDVSHNPLLKLLSCTNNSLTELDMSENIALESLYCASNQLTNLNVSGNVLLEELHCSRNKLTDLDVGKCIGLWDLGCAENQLTKLDVSNNTSLIRVECSHNSLTSLDLSNMNNMISFLCYDQKVVTNATRLDGVLKVDIGALVGAENIDRVSFEPEAGYEIRYADGIAEIETDALPEYITYQYDTRMPGNLDEAYMTVQVMLKKCEDGEHTFGDWIIKEEPSYTSSGRKVRICSTCGFLEEEILEPLESVITFSKEELYLNIGDVASLSEQIDRIQADDPIVSWESSNSRVASVDANGTATATDIGVADITVTTESGASATIRLNVYCGSLDEPDHAYEEVIERWPTCTWDGSAYQQCKDCGKIGSERVLPATGHQFGAYRITKEETIFETGLEESTCSVCGTTSTRVRPKLEPEVQVTEEEISLQIGKMASLETYVTGLQKGDAISAWGSDNTGAVSVDESGRATANEVGTAVITVTTKGGVSKKITVRVYCGSAEEPDHTYEEVIEQAATCTEDGKAYQKCTVCGKKKDGSDRVIEAAGHQFGPYEVVTEATVFKSGLEESVCAVCKEKRTQILPRLEAAVRYSQEGLTIQLGETVSVKGYVTGIQNGDLITRWRSFAPNIAKVDTDGNVTAMRAGLAYIAVGTRAGAVAKLLVTVEDHTVHTTGISNLHTGLKLEAGKSIALHPVIEPADSQDPVIYGSVAPNIATVSKDGVIKAIRVGLANIYVKSGTEYRKILVRVIAPSLTAITGVRKTGSLYEGVTYQLRPQRYPLGSAGVFYYKSSDPEIASVDKDGKVTAKKKGFTTITVTARGVSTAMRLRVK